MIATSGKCIGIGRIGSILSSLIFAIPSYAEDWPGWRGPMRNGHTRELSGWNARNWPTDPPTWTTRVGEGCTSPIVHKGRLYTLGWNNKKDSLICLDITTGKELWKQSYPCPQYGRQHLGDENAYSGPTATPEFDPITGYLYTLSTDGDLAAWDTVDKGRQLWGVNLYDAYGAPRRPEVGKIGSRRDYGYITAPLVHGDWLIVAVGAKEGHLMAFDKKDGKRRWVSVCAEPAGHCGGLSPITVDGVPCLASLTLRKLVVIRLDAGKAGQTVAEYDWVTDYGNNVASPAVHENHVLITSKYNRQAICKLEITLNGARKVWQSPQASGACTPVIHEGHVYWTSERMYCLDFKTGRLIWEGGSFGSPGSCLVTGDRKLIVWGERGKLVFVEPAGQASDKYKELTRRLRLTQALSWPHVVLAEKRLFCKDREGNLTCFLVNP